MTENDIGTIIVTSAIEVHKELGPGLLEIVYEVTLAQEPRERGLNIERQVAVPIDYKDMLHLKNYSFQMLDLLHMLQPIYMATTLQVARTAKLSLAHQRRGEKRKTL